MGLAPVVQSDLIGGLEGIHPADQGVGFDMYGSTSGYAGIKPRAVETNIRWFLPPADGAANMPIVTDGSLGLAVGTSAGIRTALGLGTADSVSFASITADSFTVTGGATVVTSEITVHDPLIKLASDNVADVLDLGFYAKYVSSGTKYTGFFRDATDGKYKLFDGLTVEPITTVNIAGSGYNLGLLTANIEGVKAAFGPGAVINNGTLLWGTNYNTTLLVQDTISSLSSSKVVCYVQASADPVADSGTGCYVFIASNYVKAGNTKNIGRLYGGWLEAIHFGTGTVTSMYGGYAYSQAEPGSPITSNYGMKVESYGGTSNYGIQVYSQRRGLWGVSGAGTCYGLDIDTFNDTVISSGTDVMYGVKSVVARTSATGGDLTTYNFYSRITGNTLAGTSGNNHFTYDFYAAAHQAPSNADYFLWFGSVGVYRIKTDGVVAYYNPAFLPAYTPNAVDYERVVQQWNANVLEYGLEAGGTGTLRAMRLLGTSVTATSFLGPVNGVTLTAVGVSSSYLRENGVYGAVPYADLTGTPSTFSPSVHAASHMSAGADAIRLDELKAPTDVTTLDVSITLHGLVPKAPNDATKFLNGVGAWSVPAGGSSTPPGGSDTQVQFNDGGVFAGDSGLVFNKTTNVLTAGGFTGPLTGNVTGVVNGVTLTAAGSSSNYLRENGVYGAVDFFQLTSIPSTFPAAAHASTHMSGGTDPIRLDELKAPTDVTTLNVTTALHGLTPKAPNDVTKFLDGTAAWSVPVHNSLSGLTTGDPHTQYAILAGRAGGQAYLGDTASGGNITIESTAHATKGNIYFGAAGALARITSTGKFTANGTYQTLTAASDGATITFDLAASNFHKVTLGGNRILALSIPTTGQSFTLRLTQDGTGSRTVTWFSGISWAGGSAPVLTTTAAKTDTLGFLCTGAGTYDGFVMGQNI